MYRFVHSEPCARRLADHASFRDCAAACVGTHQSIHRCLDHAMALARHILESRPSSVTASRQYFDPFLELAGGIVARLVNQPGPRIEHDLRQLTHAHEAR